ncbi:very short patch repair endonuclease [Rubellimicrobium rubrum]|uniref:Very short patch repair endonuclease n=1 Tax=Rubellimicrobium rubrum TaxID=2585369 RepID=A0A5C4MJ67_9RHOB|nr:very short patch repair endonuclease [Rubellimicrobium rubrum]TNC45237.1 very short patch repair endonuclease [Rubellimicrobium rubrum]
MSAEKRSALMSRIRGRDTGPEKRMREILQRLGVDFTEQDRGLPGRPDFVLVEPRLVILVDGDFWHGWRFDEWKHKLSSDWRRKIQSNIRRDRRNRTALRADGWTVVRVWEHQLERSTPQVRRRLRDNLRRIAAARGLAKAAEPATEDA